MVSEVQATRSAPQAARRGDWGAFYARNIAVCDFFAIAWAVVGAQLLRFGVSSEEEARISRGFDVSLNYTMISVILVVAWMVSLAVFKTRDARVIGVGATEYRRVAQATLWLFGLTAIIVFLLKIDIARAYILIALPAGLLMLLVNRWLWRQILRASRARGLDSYRVVLVGSASSVAAIARDLASAPSAGYRVVAAVVPNAPHDLVLPGRDVAVGSDPDQIIQLMAEHEADTLVITSSDELPPQRIRELSWQLEPGRQHLVMAPSLTDVGGPRIHMRPVAGLPLMHVETPTFEGPQLFLKRTFDLVGSVVLLVVLSPVMLVIAALVKLSSPGPVLFAQDRVGLRGRPFRMLKFRSMVADAEAQLAPLLDRERDAGNHVLFKLKDDPRVTPLGRVLRRFSLDELPQLFNVLAGSMSLVGPRPPLPREVEAYEDHVHRKFLVKPGATGLWQVNGRSQLSWEESVRLDLYYVENWSLMGDLVIVWRTIKAILHRGGAY